MRHRVTAGIAAVVTGMMLTPAAVAQSLPPGGDLNECVVIPNQELQTETEHCPSQTGSSTRTQFFDFVSNLGTRISQQRHVVRDPEGEPEEGSDTTAGLRGGAASADDTGITAYGRLSAFGVADYSASDREATGKGDAYDQHNEAVILGLDYRFSNTLFAGATFNYLTGDTDFTGAEGPLGSTDVDSYVFGLHGSKYWGDVFLEALVTYGEFDLDIERIDRTGFFPARYGASPEGNISSADVALGYVHSRGRWRVTPSTKLLYMDGSIDGYLESLRSGSGSPRAVEKQDFEALNAELAVQFDYVVLKNWGVLIPSLKLAYNHEFEDPHTVRGVQIGLGGGSFAERPEAPDADTASVRLGVSAQLKRGWSAFASFEKLFEHSYIDRNNIAAGVRYEFF